VVGGQHREALAALLHLAQVVRANAPYRPGRVGPGAVRRRLIGHAELPGVIEAPGWSPRTPHTVVRSGGGGVCVAGHAVTVSSARRRECFGTGRTSQPSYL